MGSKEKGTAKKDAVKVGPAVIWIIPKTDYFIESTGDGLPIFHHNEFTFKAIAPGSGNIAWYIACTERHAVRPCPVQGVRNKDGRLLMLRSHNHFQKNPQQKRKSSPPVSSNVEESSPLPPKKSPRLSMPEAIRDRWLTLTSPKVHANVTQAKPRKLRSSGQKKIGLLMPQCETDCEISFIDGALQL